MNQAEIHEFLVDFFEKRHASIMKNEPGLLQVRLTEELDKQLMNRPFYWQYVKNLGYQGEPMTVTFISDENKKDKEGEWVHFGSPRLEQLFQIILKEGKYAELYETIENEGERKALYPWLVCNMIVRYQGAYVHDELVSVGVLLTDGTMRFRWMDEVMDQNFDQTIPNYCYKAPFIISPKRAFSFIEQEIKQRISNKSSLFEQESIHLYKEEMGLVEELFKDREDDVNEIKENTEKQIYNRLYPQVKLKLINSGLFYLTLQTTKQLTTVH